MRDQARAVIIGGGVGGASIAYHLAQLGWDDVVLVERDQLTSGSTFHSAGLVGQLRSSVTLTRMMMYGTELYRRLGDGDRVTTPAGTRSGSLRLASTPARLEELTPAGRVGADVRAAAGADLDRARRTSCSTACSIPTGVLGAVWLPTDGWLNPSDLTMALAAGARAGGVEIATMTRVTGIGVDEHRRAGGGSPTSTPTGAASTCEVVVNAGGHVRPRDRPHGRRRTCRSCRWPTSTRSPGRARPMPEDLPTMRDPDRLVYFREEVGGLIVGGYERNPEPWCVDGDIPPDLQQHAARRRTGTGSCRSTEAGQRRSCRRSSTPR